MTKKLFFLPLLAVSFFLYSQETAFKNFLADTAMKHAAVSFCIAETDSSNMIFEYNSDQSLTPASIMKLITTSAALELLGPDYKFRTSIGYAGVLKKGLGKLNGDIVIMGGGDPVLGSKEFGDHYIDFSEKWIDELKNAGIKRIKGRVITDDSYYDYQPVPPKWLWEDIGNYYGAGAYGLSVFDNTYEIHFITSSDSLHHVITGVYPEECRVDLKDRLTVSGTEDEGYVFAAPYSNSGWLAGTIPVNQNDFVLKASIQDPPLLFAKIIDKKLREAGIRISGTPAVARLESPVNKQFTRIAYIDSPPLKDIVEVLNHESVNLYAEHLLKELGRVFKDSGTVSAGIETIEGFLERAGVEAEGMFIEDGSGLSPLNAINASDMVSLLIYMKKDGKHFSEFLNSLPEAGKEGTLKYYFKDNIFAARMVAKSGSMTRVRSYAGYLQTISGKELAFCIIVNNFTGSSRNIVAHFEDMLKEIITNE